MQREDDAVGRQRGGDAFAQLAGEDLECLAAGYAGRDAIGEERRRQLDATLPAGVDDPAERVVASGEGQQLLTASDDAETFQRRRFGGEGVRLVHDAAGDQAHRESPCDEDDLDGLKRSASRASPLRRRRAFGKVLVGMRQGEAGVSGRSLPRVAVEVDAALEAAGGEAAIELVVVVERVRPGPHGSVMPK